MSILPQPSSTAQDNTTRRTEAFKRTEAATYSKIVTAIESQQRRMEAARKATAEFLGYDDGDIIFAA